MALRGTYVTDQPFRAFAKPRTPAALPRTWLRLRNALNGVQAESLVAPGDRQCHPTLRPLTPALLPYSQAFAKIHIVSGTREQNRASTEV